MRDGRRPDARGAGSERRQGWLPPGATFVPLPAVRYHIGSVSPGTVGGSLQARPRKSIYSKRELVWVDSRDG